MKTQKPTPTRLRNEVSARELLERRARRLVTLLKLDAPDLVLAAEVGLLAQAIRRGHAAMIGQS